MAYENKVIVDVSDTNNCFFNAILISLQREYPTFKFLDKSIQSYNNDRFTEAIQTLHGSEDNTIRTQAIELDPRIGNIFDQDIYSSPCKIFDDLTITYIARLLKISIRSVELSSGSNPYFNSFNLNAQLPRIDIWCNKYNKSHYKGIINKSQVRATDKTYDTSSLFNPSIPIPTELSVIPDLVQKVNSVTPATPSAPIKIIVDQRPGVVVEEIVAHEDRPQNIILPRNYGTLSNVGNSCYLNTTLQLLYRIHSLRHALENINVNMLVRNPRITQDVFETSKNLVRILKRVFQEFSRGDRRGDRSINLNTLDIDNGINAYTTIVQITGLTCGEQEDMTEFLVNLISHFEPLYNNEDVRNLINSITHNQILTTYCQNRKISITNKYEVNDSPIPERNILDLDRILQLQLINRNSNIQDLINNYQQIEDIQLDDNLRDNCIIRNNTGQITNNNRIATQQQRRITNLPLDNSSDYYIISLKRFGVNRDATGRAISRYKISDSIQVNPIIRLHNRNYQIMGCGVHMGNVKGGHYIYVDYINGIASRTYNDSRDYPITDDEQKQIITGGYVYLYKNIGSTSTISSVPLAPSIPQVSLKPELKVEPEVIPRRKLVRTTTTTLPTPTPAVLITEPPPVLITTSGARFTEPPPSSPSMPISATNPPRRTLVRTTTTLPTPTPTPAVLITEPPPVLITTYGARFTEPPPSSPSMPISATNPPANRMGPLGAFNQAGLKKVSLSEAITAKLQEKTTEVETSTANRNEVISKLKNPDATSIAQQAMNVQLRKRSTVTQPVNNSESEQVEQTELQRVLAKLRSKESTA
jgi:ubiquitin C-terminal hydrolase